MKLSNLDYMKERLSEPSTWRGIIAILVACGVGISPEQATAIIAAGMAVMGAIGTFTKDKK